jgi:copper homeostasis protein
MLEVCVDNIQAAVAAERAGAQRIEMCAALDIGGVTPCRALLEAVRARVSCPIIVLIRPRGGNFVFDQCDAEQSLASVAEAISIGAQGVAVGGLTSQDALDVPLLRAIADLAAGARCELVMHRAFDFVSQPALALEQLVTLGYDRVLTSGRPTGGALHNCAALKHLNDQARERITIMPGGGVSAENVHTILSETHCNEVHGSFRMPNADAASSVSFGKHVSVDAAAISRARQSVDAVIATRCK